MTNRETIYTGVSRSAWGYFFLYFNINLGSVNILPEFVAFLLFLSSIKLLTSERRDLALLRPLGILLTLWHLAKWVLTIFGITLGGVFSVLSLVISLASLYFHFQLITDFAALASKYQWAEEHLDQRLLKWRTCQTVLLTLSTLLAYPMEWLPDWWQYLIICTAVICLIACIGIMVALFGLRKCIRDWIDPTLPT